MIGLIIELRTRQNQMMFISNLGTEESSMAMFVLKRNNSFKSNGILFKMMRQLQEICVPSGLAAEKRLMKYLNNLL